MSWFSLTAVLDALSVLSPVRFATIHDNEHGVLFRFGNVKKIVTASNGLFNSGIHWYPGWWMGSVEALPNSEQTMETEYQSVETLDGKSLTVTCSINYRVVDPQAALINVNDYVGSMMDVICGVIASDVGTKRFSELNTQRKMMLGEIKASLDACLDRWGIEVLSVEYNNFTTAPAYRLLADPFAVNG